MPIFGIMSCWELLIPLMYLNECVYISILAHIITITLASINCLWLIYK